jgi:DNA (cytosine-5)-methyltransferase 1
VNFIDLFAGAGGLSEGFMRAGFKPIAHVEMDAEACNSIRTRLAFYYLKKIGKLDFYYSYQKGEVTREMLYSCIPQELLDTVINKKIDSGTIPQIFKSITHQLRKENRRTVDLIIGGPPCQAYSGANKSINKRKLKKDERNYLYKEYAKFLKKYKPKVFVFENVPGLYTSNNGLYYKNLKKYFKKIGYHLDDKILDASDFGVLQRRERVILIGWKKNIKFNYPTFRKVKHKWVVKHLFNDLPELKAGESRMVDLYTKRAVNQYLKKYELRNGVNFVTHNIARPHNKKDLKIYKLAISTLEKGKSLRNDEIPKKNRTQKNITSFLDRFKVVAENKISHTMIAHISKDGHHYIHPNKERLRSITVREAARIQSFPDDYFFEGGRTAAFKQIGNAVPPLLALEIAKKIKSLL